MNLYFEIGEVVNITPDARVECLKKGDLVCLYCCFNGNPAICHAVSCVAEERPDGNDVIFLRHYEKEGGENE